MKRLILTCLLLPACVPEHDYEGTYEMTYDVLLSSADGTRDEAVAGTTPVEVRHGLNDEYLIHLGASFCLLEGSYIAAQTYQDHPFMEVAPQPCFFTRNGKTFPMSLSGTATYTDGEERFAIVLGGSYSDAEQTPGSAVIELTESW